MFEKGTKNFKVPTDQAWFCLFTVTTVQYSGSMTAQVAYVTGHADHRLPNIPTYVAKVQQKKLISPLEKV